jgi:RNA polymerase sigma factor (sigma-70 family)
MTQNGPDPTTPQLNQWAVTASKDRDALGRLYDLSYESVLRYCIRRTGDRSIGEDLTSIVFMTVAQKIPTVSMGSYDDFLRWVFAFANNEILAHFRKDARRSVLMTSAVAENRLHIPSNEPDPIDSDLFELNKAMKSLSEREQSILSLRYFASLSYEAIGAIHCMRAGTVRAATARALERLRTKLGTQL